MTIAVIFRFLMAWGGICSAPIPKKSPSPATTTTFKSGLPILIPIAIGNDLPCIPCIPKGCCFSSICTILPEHPIPATITDFSAGCSFSTIYFSNAPSKPLLTPKSPHPGHHLKSYSGFLRVISIYLKLILYQRFNLFYQMTNFKW